MTMLAQNTFTVKRATKDGYSCSLSSYSVMLNADSNGVVNGLSAASTTVKLYQGSTAVTPVISIDSVSNCSVSISGLNVSIVSVPNNTKSGYVDIKIVYGSFVKIERYSFTVVDYTIVKSYTQTIVGDQMTSYATKKAVDTLGQTVSDQSTTIQQNSKDITLKASQSDVTALGNRMASAEASIKPDAICLTVAQQTANIASYMRGKMLYRDPTFSSGNNGTNVYNNSGGGTVTVVRTSGISGNPNNSGYCLKIDNTGTASPGLGGFYFATQTRAGAVLVTRIIANIPIGYTINWASNNYGSGGNLKWLTSQKGTGTWTEYICVVTCGATGTFSSTNFFYLTGSGTVTWYVAYATVFDTTEVDDTPTTDEIKASLSIDTGGISLFGKKIRLDGMVSFKSLSDYSDVDGRIKDAQTTADNAKTSLGTLTTNLRDLAYKSKVEEAMKEEGLISGAFIKMSLIDVKNVVAQGISAQTIDAGNATLKNLTVDNVTMTNADVSGKITANTGTIGALRIDGNKLTNQGSDSDAAISLWNISHGTSVRIGENVLSSTTGMMSTAIFQNNRKDSPRIPVLACVCEASGSSDSNIGLYINATGTTQYDDDLRSGNHAIYIPTGNICGFRPRGRSISSSKTLDDMDCIIFTKNTNTITLTLPSSPQYDQFYFIKRCESGGVNINAYPNSLSFKNYNSRMTTWSPGWQGVFLNWDKSSNMWWASLTVGM